MAQFRQESIRDFYYQKRRLLRRRDAVGIVRANENPYSNLGSPRSDGLPKDANIRDIKRVYDYSALPMPLASYAASSSAVSLTKVEAAAPSSPAVVQVSVPSA